ncbi:GNAT family N-acetyltransferase [Luteipulveratus halotolerans]|uniref:GCN5 family acetyltransferase n=1 Tax=Luteipulveratus halotolerans TaxID=1631356 RepID=A0A0L6CL65_9MICO|nr:GNAT family N-acetyltransferase [Luteipulveratus halotolerans]KNX38531.1 GCN5 family acetyltransferase [Luteipulveratus halotolerans]
MEIRPYADADWLRVAPIVTEVVRAAETFTYDPAMPPEALQDLWIERPPGLTVVAVDGDDVLGTAKMGPNKPGPGAHVATASYMVGSTARGRGVGRALVEHSLAWAKAGGFAAIQFNAVAASNVRAVGLYESLGFTIIGTVPEAFEHPTQGRVGLHVMHRFL